MLGLFFFLTKKEPWNTRNISDDTKEKKTIKYNEKNILQRVAVSLKEAKHSVITKSVTFLYFMKVLTFRDTTKVAFF